MKDGLFVGWGKDESGDGGHGRRSGGHGGARGR
jgi:hypothetical protein